jgi:zinc transporter
MTTVLLPINLITGVFGMNTGGLPWADSSDGFWHALVFMSIGVVVSLGVLHRRQIL